MRIVLFFFAVCAGCMAQSPQTTRAGVDINGRGVAGYIHRPAAAVTVRIVLQATVLKTNNGYVDWSADGVGWKVEVHPGIEIMSARELIPLSIHEYKLKARADRTWPPYGTLEPTTVFRKNPESKQWDVVAGSDRSFVWPEGFILQPGDVIALRAVGY